MSLKEKISYPVFYAIALVLIGLGIIFGPIVPLWIVIPLVIFLFFVAYFKKWLKEFKISNLASMFFITLIFLFTSLFISGVTIHKVSWFRLITIGIISDVIGFFVGLIPIIGGLIAAIIIFILIITIVPGVNGFILSAVAGMIALILNFPGIKYVVKTVKVAFWPLFFITTIILIIFKIIAMIVASGLEAIV